MIYTSYFANLRRLPATVRPIGICVSPPRWFVGENDQRLAPSRELLTCYKSGSCSMLDYWDRYWAETLSILDPNVVYRDLCSKDSPDVALCCYEAPHDFCHRHILAHWLTQVNLGIVVREYGQPSELFGG
jgi:uncharacterized protein YeaO (DUF488 family)